MKIYLNKIIVVCLILASIPCGVTAKGDLCHVYLIDINAYRKALARYEKTNNQKDVDRTIKTFPVFETIMGEEEVTTTHYRIPHSKRIITASVFYTDESITTSLNKDGLENDNSILLGIAVTPKKEVDAIINYSNNAVAELSYDDNTNIVRVKKYLIVNHKKYLVVLECDCAAKRKNKERNATQQ
jgi:hypothetical protein